MLKKIAMLSSLLVGTSTACIGPVTLEDVAPMDLSETEQQMAVVKAGGQTYFIRLPSTYRSDWINTLVQLMNDSTAVYIKELPEVNDLGYRAMQDIYYHAGCSAQ